MSRGLLPGLPSPHPLGECLPALYQRDDLSQRMLAALDEVLAPVFLSLDNLDAYLDPGLAPEDFLDWLGGWLGLAMDDAWPLERRRAIVARAAELYRIRGTPRGLVAYMELLTGGEVEIEESGGAAWSSVPGEPPPGRAEAELVVKVRAADGPAVQAARLDALVAANKPAHVSHRLELTQR